MRLILDIRKTVEQNAAGYFERAKKFKHKAQGAREAVARFNVQLQKFKETKAGAALPEKSTRLIKEQKSKQWYEKFRWFLSSEGILCIGGRDATSNEILLKKHTDKHDLVCHTDAPGSPFFVVKTEGVIPSQATVDEALQATASYSRAWKLGVSVADAYCVKPEQVTKTAPSGESLSAKGSFMITGKRETASVGLKLAIGVLSDGRIMAGPETAVRKHCAKVMFVVQSDDKPSDAAKKIRKYLGAGELDEIIRALPAGGSKVVGM